MPDKITVACHGASCGSYTLSGFSYVPLSSLNAAVRDAVDQWANCTGMLSAVLGPEQFKNIEPVLLANGFTLAREFNNRVHNWPNRLYLRCTDDFDQQPVKERDGIFA